MSKPKMLQDIDNINNNLSNITSQLADKVHQSDNLDFSLCNTAFGEPNKPIIIYPKPISNKGKIALNIKSGIAVTNVPVVLFIKNSDSSFTIKSVTTVNLNFGNNAINTGLEANGTGNEYVGIQQITSGMLQYTTDVINGYYQSVNNEISALDSGDTIAFTKLTNATFAITTSVIMLNGATLLDKTIQVSKLIKRWTNKKMICLGDSITWGQINDAGHQGVSWVWYMEMLLGVSIVKNYGIPGSTIGVGDNGYQPMATRYVDMDNDADLVCVWGGVNDDYCGIPLGVQGDQTTATFYGSLNVLINGLINKYPTSTIVFITPMKCNKTTQFLYQTSNIFETYHLNRNGNTLVDYKNAILNMCDYYSIPVLNLFEMGGITPYNTVHLETFFGDGLHPSNAGYARLANTIASFVEQL